MIENDIIDDTYTMEHASDLLVYLVLLRFQGQNKYCWPSLKTIAEKARLSKRECCYALKRLEHSRRIDRFSRPGMSTEYQVYRIKETDKEIEKIIG